MRWTFDGFTVDPQGFRLERHGREIPLERRTFDLLCYLLTHRDRVVTKEELLAQVWEARALSDGALSNTVAKLRRALGQSGRAPHPIETSHGRGYRFCGEVTCLDDSPRERGPTIAATSSDPFVGRGALLRALTQRMLRSQGGSENITVLTGEAGIGKTRTARELALRARSAGLSVWFGASFEGVATPPYWPWTQILRQAFEELPESVWRACLPPAARALGQLVPEHLPATPVEASAEPQRARFQLFEEVSGLLRRLSSERRLLLVFDDLQEADLGSLELLRFVARALEEQAVMFLATLRQGGVGEANDAQAVFKRLGRAATVLPLSGLSAEEVWELAVVVAGDERVDEQAGKQLYARTRGNPLFVRQALELMVQRGDRSFVDGLSGSELPQAVQHVIRERLNDLPELTRRALAAASVVGKRFDAGLVAELLELPLEGILDALEPALRAGVLEHSQGAPEELGFAHVLARDLLYEEASLRERGTLHTKIARALTRRGGTSARHLGAVAHHHLCALPFEVEPAVSACRKAAAAAQEASGFEAAAALLTRAIGKLETEGGDAETRFRLRLELGEDHFYAGLIASAWQAFRDAAETARLGERGDLLAEAAPRLVDCLELGVGDLALARGVVERALASRENQRAATLSMLLAQQAELALELPWQARFQLLDRAQSLAQQSGDLGAVLEVAHSRTILRDPHCLAENARAAEAFLELTDRHSEAATGMRYRSLRRFGACMTRYLCALTACDLEAADLALEQCQHIADTSHVRAARFATDLMRAGRALGDHRLADLQQIIPAFWQRAVAELPTETYAWANYYAMLLEAQGNLQVIEAMDLGVFASGPERTSKHDTYFAIGRAHIMVKLGRLDAARALLAQVPASDLARMPVQYGDVGAMCDLVQIYRAIEDLSALRELTARLRPYAAYNAVGPSFEYRGAVAHFLGLAARTLGNEPAARTHLLSALEVNRILHMPARIDETERALEA